MSELVLDKECIAKASLINPGDWKLEIFEMGLFGFFFCLFPLTEFCVCINEF